MRQVENLLLSVTYEIIRPVVEVCFLVPYSRKSVTHFSPHALRGIKNKKSGGYYKIRMLK
jgi:hypothetical protein